jgi:predicted GNAT family acetyltransferase
MKVLRVPSQASLSTDLLIRAVDPYSADLEYLFTHDGVLDRGFLFERTQYNRIGGEYVVGYSRSEPVACAGWFPSGELARFRYIYTVPAARGRGFASTLIRHVVHALSVRQRKEVVIFVGEGGPDELYERLGFRTLGHFWSALQLNN